MPDPSSLAAYGGVPDPGVCDLLRTILSGAGLSGAARQVVRAAVAGGADPGLVRLLPMLHRHPALAELGPAERAAVAAACRDGLVRFVYLEASARRTVEQLARAGIRSLLLKGYPLARSYYPHPALRPMADLDLAVPSGRLAEALAVLAAAGLREKDGQRSVPGAGIHAVALTEAEGPFELDLHAHVLVCSRSVQGDAGFWREAVPLAVKGAPAATLCREHQLLHALLHGYGQNAGVLPVRWIVDAAMILGQAGAFRWPVLYEEADRQRCAGPLAAALGWLEASFALGIPAAALATLAAASSPPDDAYFRLCGRLPPQPSLAWRARFAWADFQRLRRMEGRAERTSLVSWLCRRWGAASLGDLPAEIRRRWRPASQRTGSGD